MAQANAAAGFPNKPVKLIVPFAAGGATDVTGRVIGDALARKWGQAVVVENRGGAGGTLGAAVVAKAPADGYTLVLGVTGSHGIAGSLYPKLPYDAQKDFEPVSGAVSYANAILVHPESPAKNLRDYIALAKTNKDYQTYGSDGNGTASHLTMELLKSRGDFPGQAVQYKGSAPLLTDLAAGFVKVAITGLPAAEQLLKAGKVRLLAVTTLADQTGNGYPSIAEQGFTGFQAAPWSAVFAPKGTPKAIVEKISKDIRDVLAEPDVKERLAAQGMQPKPTTPDEFRAQLNTEIKNWAEAVKISGATID
jgi:tripartite-type tricarboxylate transporter receptor subunit TctC